MKPSIPNEKFNSACKHLSEKNYEEAQQDFFTALQDETLSPTQQLYSLMQLNTINPKFPLQENSTLARTVKSRDEFFNEDILNENFPKNIRVIASSGEGYFSFDLDSFIAEDLWLLKSGIAYLNSKGTLADEVDCTYYGTQLMMYYLDSAESACLAALVLATQDKFHSTKTANVTEAFNTFLYSWHSFYPQDLPNYLHHDFIELLINPKLFNVDRTSVPYDERFKTRDDLKSIKEQLLKMILALKDQELKQQALWQVLVPQTFLGGIFYIKRGSLAPSLGRNKGELQHAAVALLNLLNISDEIHINEQVKSWLTKSSVKKYFPSLQLALDSNSLVKSSKSFLTFREVKEESSKSPLTSISDASDLQFLL